MNRIDFMSRLSLLLSELPESERREAIQYYEDYLNDAGVENEEEVLAALGTPEELAASIREGLEEGSEQQGEFSEHGFSEKGERLANEVARRETDGGKAPEPGAVETNAASGSSSGYPNASESGNSSGYRNASESGSSGYRNASESGSSSGYRNTSESGSSSGYRDTSENGGRQQRAGYGGGRQGGPHGGASAYGASADAQNGMAAELDRRYRGRGKRKGMSGGMITLLVILCIIAAPVVIPLAVALAVVVAVLAFVAVLLAGIFLMVGVICIVAGVVALAGAAAKLFVYPAGAVLAIGMSLLTIGLGILLTILIGWIISQVFPKAFRGVADFVGGLFHKKGGNAA